MKTEIKQLKTSLLTHPIILMKVMTPSQWRSLSSGIKEDLIDLAEKLRKKLPDYNPLVKNDQIEGFIRAAVKELIYS